MGLDLNIRQLASLISYGEMVTLRMGSKTWVVLNSDRVVSEIIAKRGENYQRETPHAHRE